MEYLALILTILFVDLWVLVSPGPNFVLISSAAVTQSREHAIWTACGIATGSFTWAAAAALGLASVFEVFPVIGLILKLVGAAYLIYLGLTLLRSQGFRRLQKKAEDGRTGYWRGFLVNMTNPKSAAYYASVFAAFLTPDMPVWVLGFLVSAIALMSLAWHLLLAIGLSAAALRSRYIAFSKYIDRLCGGLLVVLGLRLACDSR
ncbi:LysE family translocator [Gymnodinialimonas sp. 2305UL16-5]|uniref:LysE family translocator n=1 Tax=Gymnodinialimonas mytili TaxID=3126503 RepID=UPI0030AD3EF2